MSSDKERTNRKWTSSDTYRSNWDNIFERTSSVYWEDEIIRKIPMIIKFKKLVPEAVAPAKSRPNDAAYDLVCTSRYYNGSVGNDNELVWTYHTGIAVEIPEGHVGLIFPRSNISKMPLRLCNSVGVIDPNYRGELLLKFAGSNSHMYKVGDRIGQLVVLPLPLLEFLETEELSPSPDDRGTQGFGSSGS